MSSPYHIIETRENEDGSTETLRDQYFVTNEVEDRRTDAGDAIDLVIEAEAKGIPWKALQKTISIGDISITSRVER